MLNHRVESLQELREAACEGASFLISLGSDLVSKKWIVWDESRDTFLIHNYIDNSEQELNPEEVMNNQLTLIGEAMEKGKLYLDEDGGDEM